MATPIQVLIVEDSAPDAEAMIRRLQEDGFEPDWQRVTSIGEVRARLTPSLDVILADYHLPGFTATDLLASLRELRSEVPVVVVSGMLGDEGAVDLLQDGASDYVLKDRMARLGPAVRRAMDGRSLRHLQSEMHAALRENEEMLRSMLQSIEDVVWSMRLPDRKLLFVNPSVLGLFGRSPQEVLTNPAVWREVVHPEDVGIFDAAYEHALRWGFSEAEYRIRRSDGVIRFVRARTWVGFKDGVAVRAEGILSDVTRVKEPAAGNRLIVRESQPIAQEPRPQSPRGPLTG